MNAPLFDPRDPEAAAEAMAGIAYMLDGLLHGEPRAGTGIPPDLCFMLMVTVPNLPNGEENRVAYTGNVEGDCALKLLREMVQLFEGGLGGQHLPGRAQAQ